MKTKQVYDIVCRHSGIRCQQIVDMIDMKRNSVSGILSSLKQSGHITNKDGLWYPCNDTLEVRRIIETFNDIGYDDKSWCEGYISGLCDHNVINEIEFDHLLDHIKQH